MTYFYFGIHKAATTWLIQLLDDICKEVNLNHKHYHSSQLFGGDIINEIAKNKVDFFSYTNSDYKYVNFTNIDYKGFHVIRDPRDIVVSSYFSHLNSHSTLMWPELIVYREELKGLNLSDGITATIRHLENLSVDGEIIPMFDNLKKWNYNNKNIFEIRFEDLIKNPYIIIPQIITFLDLLETTELKGMPKSKKRLLNKLNYVNVNSAPNSLKIKLEKLLFLIYKHDFYFKTKGRLTGSNDVNNHYRKGEEGDWKNYFQPNHISFFKEKYGKLLINLKYEKDYNW